MNEVGSKSWAPQLWLLGAVVVGVFLGKLLSGFSGSSETVKELKEVGNDVKALTNEMKQQTSVIHRALGKHIPLVLPEPSANTIADLERQIDNFRAWTSLQAEAESLGNRLQKLLATIPPWAEEEYLPRLVRLRWAIAVLGVLAQGETSAPPETLQELLDRRPDRAPQLVLQRLEGELGRAKHKADRERILKAKAALEKGGVPETGLAELEGLDEAVGSTKQVRDLRDQLRRKLVEKVADERVKLLKESYNRARKFDEDLRQAGMIRVREAALGLLLDLELDHVRPETAIAAVKGVVAACDSDLKGIGLRNLEQHASKLRAYQAWALTQILNFDGNNGWYYDRTLTWVNKELRSFKDAKEDRKWWAFTEFPSMKSLIEEKLEIDLTGSEDGMLSAAKRKEIYEVAYRTIGWKNSIDEEIAYRATRDGMVKFLLPINVGLLETPVAQLYHQAFNKGWTKLEGREDQLFVAKQTAVVKKRGIEDLP